MARKAHGATRPSNPAHGVTLIGSMIHGVIPRSVGAPPFTERHCLPDAGGRTTVGSAAIFKEQIASSYLLAMTMNGASLRSRVLGSGNLKINGIASSLAMTWNKRMINNH